MEVNDATTAILQNKVHAIKRWVKHPNRGTRWPDLMMPILLCGTRSRVLYPHPLEEAEPVDCKRCLAK